MVTNITNHMYIHVFGNLLLSQVTEWKWNFKDNLEKQNILYKNK